MFGARTRSREVTPLRQKEEKKKMKKRKSKESQISRTAPSTTVIASSKSVSDGSLILMPSYKDNLQDPIGGRVGLHPWDASLKRST